MPVTGIKIGAEAAIHFQKGTAHLEYTIDREMSKDELDGTITHLQSQVISLAHDTATKLAELEKQAGTPVKKEFKPQQTNSNQYPPKKPEAPKPTYQPKPQSTEYVNKGTYQLSEGQKKLLMFKKVPTDIELEINSYNEFNDFINNIK